jgi:serine phosphatase RsbU (regulator of sigma subunit)
MSAPPLSRRDAGDALPTAGRPVVLAVGVAPALAAAPVLGEALDLRPAGSAEAKAALAGGACEAILLDGCLPAEELEAVLEAAGPTLVPGRPMVLVLAEPGRASRVENRLIDRVDDFVNRGRGAEAVLARVRNGLKVRNALIELQRKNAELEGLYGRLEGLARRMAEELRLAGNLQRSLLPPPLHHARLDLAREFLPVREIGGDYFDLVALGASRFAIALGDVMGKGVPAALLAANLKACLRGQIQDVALPITELVARVNRLFWEVTPKGLFATLFFCVVDLERGVMEYVNAGHDHPFVVRGDGSTRELASGGTVLGILETSRYEKGELALGREDVLVGFTDGVTDRDNPAGEAFGVERLKQAALRARRDPARIALYSMLGEVQGWADGASPEDDMTLVVARLV